MSLDDIVRLKLGSRSSKQLEAKAAPTPDQGKAKQETPRPKVTSAPPPPPPPPPPPAEPVKAEPPPPGEKTFIVAVRLRQAVTARPGDGPIDLDTALPVARTPAGPARPRSR